MTILAVTKTRLNQLCLPDDTKVAREPRLSGDELRHPKTPLALLYWQKQLSSVLFS